MRNNEDRVGAKPSHDPPPGPTAPAESAGDPLSFVVPTEFVELPTKGAFYPEGHPLHNQECIEIKFMTAKEEDILTSRTLLKKGIAIERLLQNLIADKRIKTQDLFVGDRNAILVAARCSGYGPEYKASVTCPACGANEKHEFNLENKKLSGFLENNHVLQDTGVVYNEQERTFSLTLPKTKVEVELKLLTGHDERKMADLSERKRKAKKQENVLTDQLKTYVVSVNGETNPQIISRFIESLPVLDSRELRTVYSNIVPNIDMSQEFLCSSCDYQETLEVPFTAEFFWPK